MTYKILSFMKAIVESVLYNFPSIYIITKEIYNNAATIAAVGPIALKPLYVASP